MNPYNNYIIIFMAQNVHQPHKYELLVKTRR